jgi:DNA-binding PadR family transcriptional regulator
MSGHAQRAEDLLPLTPAVFSILLALADGEKHGYGIMREVEAGSGGRGRMGPGTLYGSIKRMVRAGLIEESDERPDPALDDQRRRYYRLSGVGRRVLQLEVIRLQDQVALARAKRVLGSAVMAGGG